LLSYNKVGVVKGYATISYILKNNPEIKIVEVTDNSQGLEQVSFGEIDAFITDTAVASYYIDKLGITNLKVAGAIGFNWELCFASRKDLPILHSILTKGLSLVTHEEREKIFKKWIHIGIKPFYQTTEFYIFFGVSLFIILFIIITAYLWNQTLQIEINKKTKEFQKSEDKFRSLVESTSDWIWEIDKNDCYTYSSPRIKDLLGYEPEEILGKSVFDLMGPDESDKIKKEYYQYKNAGLPLKGIININIHKNGKEVYHETSGIPFFNDKGSLIGYRGIDRDITDRIEAMKNLKASLKEKEILMLEIHHRVKNNLAIISSLLSLQGDNQPEYKQLISDNQRRIEAMALIHKMLYENRDFQNINFSHYVKIFTSYLFDSYNIGKIPIALEIKIKENQTLSIDKAMPCSMLINELISNSLEHGFVNKNEGKIFLSIDIDNETDDIEQIIFKDNGSGFENNEIKSEEKNLGMKLIQNLALQLDLSLSLNTSKIKGTEYIFTHIHNDKTEEKNPENILKIHHQNNIYLVEDEIIILMHLENMLINSGYHIIGKAARAEKIIDDILIQNLLPDLIIMDIRLKSKMDGIDAVLKIRRKYTGPIVFRSGYDTKSIKERIDNLNLKNCYIIEKSDWETEILELIEEILVPGTNINEK
ncbi:MAG: PAS domain S-box protein, partial [Spirochaetes bacterium]|nr:PAS domain S-box protein [Spirochaetota bacterium]